MKSAGGLALILLACGGCGVLLDFDPPDPRGVDGGATGTDMFVSEDLGTDAHRVDLGSDDLGRPDAVVVDGRTSDAFPIDLPAPDLPTSRDAGPDFSIPDIGIPDIGGPDLIVTSGCGGAGLDCLPGQYCSAPPGACDDRVGVCMLIPMGCGGAVAPVCGCDGNTYSNACFAAASGVNVARDGTCSCSHSIDCCCVDTDCLATEECIVDVVGGSGRCETRLTSTGGCWRDSDCGVGAVCLGAMVCPCGVSCFAPDTPGSCG